MNTESDLREVASADFSSQLVEGYPFAQNNVPDDCFIVGHVIHNSLKCCLLYLLLCCYSWCSGSQQWRPGGFDQSLGFAFFVLISLWIRVLVFATWEKIRRAGIHSGIKWLNIQKYILIRVNLHKGTRGPVSHAPKRNVRRGSFTISV